MSISPPARRRKSKEEHMRYMLLIGSEKTEVPTAPPSAAAMQDLYQAHVARPAITS
jgi:hypothetical protein